MTLRQLLYFARIVEIGSLSRAAQALHVAQPALSQQVSRLEEELGVTLLLRSVRGVVPTQAGLAVYRHAKAILKQVDATRLIAQEADAGPAGQVTLGLPWTVSTLLGLPLLQQVKARLPAVRLEIVGGPSPLLANMLAEGRLELTVVFDNQPRSGLDMRPVLVEPLYFIGPPHTLATTGTASISDVARRPLVLLSRPNSIRERLDAALAAAGLRAEVVAEINDAGLLLGAVRTGLGYSVVPACGVAEGQRQVDVDSVLLDDPSLRRTVFLCTSRLHGLSLAAHHVHEILLELMQQAVRDGRWPAELVEEGVAELGRRSE